MKGDRSAGPGSSRAIAPKFTNYFIQPGEMLCYELEMISCVNVTENICYKDSIMCSKLNTNEKTKFVNNRLAFSS